jgi:endonuclease YncB( thermonuclease family)
MSFKARSLAIAAAFGALFLCPSSPARPDAIIVGQASVTDGDTVEIHGQRIRLWGIDAPEDGQLCYFEGEPWRCGQICANALSDHIAKQTLTCAGRGRDRYKRIVATCTVAGRDIAMWLVREGCAFDFPRYSKGAYAAQQGEAIAAKRGMWRGRVEAPWDWRQRRRNIGTN